jgi:hypothetical protein
MKEIHVNGMMDKGKLVASYEAISSTEITVYQIAENRYHVYFDDKKIDGHVIFPDESGNGCGNCIYQNGFGNCFLKEQYDVGCTEIKYFGSANNVSYRE